MPFPTVAVVGVGLIGGSFALALKRSGFKGRILGISSPSSIEKGLKYRVIDEGVGLEDGLARADLVYLAQPILRIIAQIPEVARLAKPGALITDAGSTKAAIVARAAESFGPETLFLGGHPMAGKEGRGVEIAEAELFEGATYVLTPRDAAEADDPRTKEFIGLVEAIGARPMTLAPDEHDRVTAWTSHMPQLVSTALAARVGAAVADDRRLSVAGGGLRDMTRLAGSSYDIWEGILKTNGEAIRNALDGLIDELSSFRDEIAKKELKSRFAEAQILHKKIPRKRFVG